MISVFRNYCYIARVLNNHFAQRRHNVGNSILSLPSCINSVRLAFRPRSTFCGCFFVILGENVKERRARNSCLHRDDTGRVWGSSLLFQRNEAYTPYTLELARVRVVNFFMPAISNLLHAAVSSFAFHSKYHRNERTGSTARRYVNFHVIHAVFGEGKERRSSYLHH